MGEFDLIERYFRNLGAARRDVSVPMGDDAAVLQVPPAHGLRVAAASVAPPNDDAPARSGFIAREAVLRACAALREQDASPAWATLALTLSRVESRWLERFAHALDQVLVDSGVALVSTLR